MAAFPGGLSFGVDGHLASYRSPQHGQYASFRQPRKQRSSLHQQHGVLTTGGDYHTASSGQQEPASASGQQQQQQSAAGGDYLVNSHEIINSPQSRYEVLELLGRGTFGQVLRCWKKDSNEVVAMKILKNLPSYTKQGQVEVDVLTRLSKVDCEQFNFVHAYESFTHHGHICIVFECLQINLYDYLKRNRFQPLPLKHIRPIAQQVLSCLKKLRELGLVHADLKPENIMLVDQDRQPFRVKVIDFGSATCRSTGLSTTYLQSRYYRAPEVILGVAYDQAIDMWSLGCVLAELFLGWPLFPGATEYDQICYISQMLGDPPAALTKNAVKMCRFFRRDQTRRQWVLKPQAQFQLETGVCPKETRKFIFTSVTAIGQVSVCSGGAGQEQVSQDTAVAQHQDKLQFIALLERLLTFDPSQRADPTSCLQHPFITMLHLAMQTASPCVREWIGCMQVCCQSRTTHSSPASTTPTYPHLLYTLDSAYLAGHAHQPHPSLVPFPSQWSSPEYYVRPVVGPTHSSMMVDTGYVSAESSPTSSQHSLLDNLPKVEFAPQLAAPITASLLLPHTPSNSVLVAPSQPQPQPTPTTSLLLPQPQGPTPASLLLPPHHTPSLVAAPSGPSLLLPTNTTTSSQYWLMLQQSGYLPSNHSRL